MAIVQGITDLEAKLKRWPIPKELRITSNGSPDGVKAIHVTTGVELPVLHCEYMAPKEGLAYLEIWLGVDRRMLEPETIPDRIVWNDLEWDDPLKGVRIVDAETGESINDPIMIADAKEGWYELLILNDEGSAQLDPDVPDQLLKQRVERKIRFVVPPF